RCLSPQPREVAPCARPVAVADRGGRGSARARDWATAHWSRRLQPDDGALQGHAWTRRIRHMTRAGRAKAAMSVAGFLWLSLVMRRQEADQNAPPPSPGSTV